MVFFRVVAERPVHVSLHKKALTTVTAPVPGLSAKHHASKQKEQRSLGTLIYRGQNHAIESGVGRAVSKHATRFESLNG
jgi:hypothetical protein